MASPGQPSYTSARCHDKGQGVDPCILKEECKFYNALTFDQKTQLATLSYKIKKDKRSEKADKKDSVTETPIDPDLISVIEAVSKPKSIEKGKEKQSKRQTPPSLHMIEI